MSSIDRDQRVIDARARATVARLRFTNSLQSTRRRLSWGRLKEDASLAVSDKITEARQDLTQTVRRHPVLAATGVLSLFAVMFWKPARIAAMYGMRGAQLVWLNRRLWREIDD